MGQRKIFIEKNRENERINFMAAGAPRARGQLTIAVLDGGLI